MSETDGPRAPTHLELLSAFFKVGILGFGGVAALARHVLVVERKILSERDFAESFGLASTLPGANTVNLAAMLGDRFRGPSGACACLAGLMCAPLIILVSVALLYSRFGQLADVRAALSGAAAAAAGVVFGISLKILRDLDSDVVAVGVAACVCIAAIANVPMLAILSAAIPLSIAGAFILHRRRG